MKQTVLITGGSGRLALNWAVTVRRRQRVVLGLHSRVVSLSGVHCRNIRLTDQNSIAKSFKEIKPNSVIHTAGLTDIEACEANPELAHLANVEAAANIAAVCRDLDVPFVHISTDHLFSGHKALVDENEPVAPINVYARTKAEAEASVLAAFPEALVVRTNFYGWGPSYRQSFSDFIVNALREQKLVTLFEDVYYTPILMQVLVEAACELLERGHTGIVNIVGDERISKYEFGLKLARKFQLSTEYIVRGRIADQDHLTPRPRDLSLSNLKVCETLGKSLGQVDEQLKMLLKLERNGLVQELRGL